MYSYMLFDCRRPGTLVLSLGFGLILHRGQGRRPVKQKLEMFLNNEWIEINVQSENSFSVPINFLNLCLDCVPTLCHQPFVTMQN